METLYNKRVGRLRVVLMRSTPSPGDPRRCWLNHGGKGKPHTRTLLSIEVGDGTRYPCFLIYLLSFALGCYWISDPPDPQAGSITDQCSKSPDGRHVHGKSHDVHMDVAKCRLCGHWYKRF